MFFTDGLAQRAGRRVQRPGSRQNLLKTDQRLHLPASGESPDARVPVAEVRLRADRNAVGIKNLDASSCRSAARAHHHQQQRLRLPVRRNKMRQDVLRMPTLDYYGSATTGYRSGRPDRVDSPQQIGYASLNAADSAVQRIRQDNDLNVVIYTIGYSGGSERRMRPG